MKKEMDKAVALGYDPAIGAPEVVAAARGLLVGKLMELARRHGIPVYRDPDLAEVLSAAMPGTQVPETLFRAVAAVMAYCYRVNDGFRKKTGKTAIEA